MKSKWNKPSIGLIPKVPIRKTSYNFPSTEVASKRLDEGAWFLLESPVVCWPLTQQEGGGEEIWQKKSPGRRRRLKGALLRIYLLKAGDVYDFFQVFDRKGLQGSHPNCWLISQLRYTKFSNNLEFPITSKNLNLNWSCNWLVVFVIIVVGLVFVAVLLVKMVVSYWFLLPLSSSRSLASMKNSC